MLTGSTWARSAASDRRRRIFENVCIAPLFDVRLDGNSPRTSRRSAAIRPSTSAATRSPSPKRSAASRVVNGPRVRA